MTNELTQILDRIAEFDAAISHTAVLAKQFREDRKALEQARDAHNQKVAEDARTLAMKMDAADRAKAQADGASVRTEALQAELKDKIAKFNELLGALKD
jgi:hypothetical protein